MSDSIAIEFLTPGSQRTEDVAARIATFLNSARTAIAMTTYDAKLSDAGRAVADVLRRADERGVDVRIVDHDERVTTREMPIPPPPTESEWVDRLGLNVHPIASFMSLMHHKYVVVDAALVWTGSLNWTDDAFTLQENCVVRVESRALAAQFVANFEELWTADDVLKTGRGEPTWVDLEYGGAPARARPFFCPRGASKLVAEIAAAVRTAERRILVCSPVLTSGPILDALVGAVTSGRAELVGVVDGTQMRQVLRQWTDRPIPSWKIDAFQRVARAGSFGRKPSIPWSPGSTHDYMHAKIVVCDDTTFAGSFNHSRAGESNAENVLQIASGAVADTMDAFVRATRERYPVAAGAT